ncbi:uncharacterized protein LOC110725477 [Chenopodium quinoa]|uniref:SHSP domain-containing protein n=1 Tax=Chenopodium quinoa TaxID=63459 RepID=A0A803LHZ4_CHEQI|nr:uncharacterized protein LOC110725477 [Chenopodium quinoa]
MELELDLKITTTKGDPHSTDFRIAKDRAGPVFLSRETETTFILTAHLRGFKREDVKIDINEDGTLISISGEKAVQEMVMKGWVMHKNEPNLKSFIKVFKIPLEVLLDRIKANYNDDESTLTIYMPKQNEGIMIGGGIEEVKNDDKQVSDHETLQEESMHESDEDDEIRELVPYSRRRIDDEGVSSSIQETEGEVCSRINGESDKTEEIVEEKVEEGCKTKQGIKEERSYDGYEMEEKNNKCTLFGPCIFIGSTLIASLVMLLVRLVKPKRH